MLIRSRAPLRLGLAGGGTDVSPYPETHGGWVLNATIDRYAYAIIEPLEGEQLHFAATDIKCEEMLTASLPLPVEGKLSLHRAVYNEMMRRFNHGRPLALRLSTLCDAPVGSGLGTSSTLVVAMVHAFAELLNAPLGDYEIAQLAFTIERIDCKLQGGMQDQYSAAFGGFNFMEFYSTERVIVNPLRIKHWTICELEASLVLFYTGVSRESSRIISDQSDNVKSGIATTIDAMHGIKQEALVMKECLLKGDLAGLVGAMRHGWEHKKRSAKTVSTQHIESIYEAAINAGALAGKVSGAGGGGFMMFFVPPEKRMNLIRTLQTFDGQISNCHFTKYGTQAWRLG
jgi:D-glycero-alpha-D-manno-heptose-7-phosphate kinase